jgi:hypothetical protein
MNRGEVVKPVRLSTCLSESFGRELYVSVVKKLQTNSHYKKSGTVFCEH